jgi:hypothetical protein
MVIGLQKYAASIKIVSRIGVCVWLKRRVLDSMNWIYYHVIHTTRDYRQYSALADLHTLEFTVIHTLG